MKIADQISREQGIDVKRCQRNSLKGNDATDIRIDIIIIEELQRLATEVQVEASAMRLQEPPHDGINTIDNDVSPFEIATR
jgi:hypothetical protein